MRLRALPARAFGADPITRKEMLEVARRGRTYIFRTIYALLLGTAIFVAVRVVAGIGGGSYSSHAEIGRIIYQVVSGAQSFLIQIAAMAFSADLISREVRVRTLGILVLTPLSARRIVFYKWRSSLAYSFMILLVSLPPLAFCVYLGGVGWDELVPNLVGTLATAGLASALAILVSSYCQRASTALIRTILLWIALNYACGCFMGGTMFALMRRTPDTWWLPWVGLVWAGLNLSLAMGLLAWTRRRLPKLALAEPKAPMARVMRQRVRDAAKPPPWWSRALGLSAGLGNHSPLLWKELRFDLRGKVRRGLIAILLLAIPLGLCAFLWPGRVADFFADGGPALLAIAESILFLVALGAGSGAFARERETKAWDALLATPLRGVDFVRAKLAGAAVAAGPWAIGFLLLTSLVGYFEGNDDAGFVCVQALAFAAFLLTGAVALSLVSRSAERAFLRGLGVAIVVLIAPPVAVWTAGVENEVVGVAVVGLSNPYAHLGGAPFWWTLALPMAALYGVAGALLAKAVVWRFDRHAPRAA